LQRNKFVSPNKPMSHQIEARKRLSARPFKPSDEDVFAYQMEMGTGKSYCLLDEWQDGVASGTWDTLIVIAPAGSYKNWYQSKSDEQQSELKAHLDPELYRKTLVAAWETGTSKRKKEQLEKLITTTNRPRAFFINVESLSTKTGASDVLTRLMNNSRALLAVDESTTIKGDSKRTEAICQLGQLAVARRLMTGLATPKSPLDLFWQFYFLDWRILGQQSPFAFKMRYAITRKTDFGGTLRRKKKVNGKIIMVPHKINIVVGYRNIDELKTRTAPYSYRVLKKDCLDLQPKVYEQRAVELTKEQRRIYNELLEYATSELSDGQHVTATSVIIRILRLHQLVCGHSVDDETKAVTDVPSNRVKAVLDILEEHEGKAIIWTTYTRELEKIAAALKQEYSPQSCVTFWGGNRNVRGEEEKRFLNDPQCRFMVATQSAGGRGNTWVNADLAIYAANSYNLEMRMQSEDRCHRKGQKNSVTYVDIIAENTVETKIVQALRNKIDLATAITGENYMEWLI